MTAAEQPQVVVVTGAGAGIGRAIALEFGRSGARVAVAARTRSDIEAVAAEIAGAGGTALPAPIDVKDPGSVEATLRDIRRALGPIDVLVNNAGAPGPRAFTQDVTPAEFLEVIQTNLWGAFLCTKFVLPAMVASRRGCIINMTGGGAASDRPLRGGIAYASSKAGVEGFTRNLAFEVSALGIAVNAIQPGRVDTRGFPAATITSGAGNLVPPDHAARLAVWLTTDEGRQLSGQTIDAVEWDRARGA
ncbi:MAG: SDR family oxidoreductase [Dehalococcoidia bacterium]